MLSETTIQQHLVKLLQAYGRPDVCWFAIPNGGLRSKKTGARLKAEGAKAGAADLFLVIDGKSFALELKRRKGRQSEAQQEWQENLERAGGTYLIAHSLKQAIATINKIGVFKYAITFTSEA